MSRAEWRLIKFHTITEACRHSHEGKCWYNYNVHADVSKDKKDCPDDCPIWNTKAIPLANFFEED